MKMACSLSVFYLTFVLPSAGILLHKPDLVPVEVHARNKECKYACKARKNTSATKAMFEQEPPVTNVASHGQWSFDTCDEAYWLDFGLAAQYVELFKDKRVVELGAGCGCYTQHLKSHVQSIVAFDGASTISELTCDMVSTKDLTVDISADIPSHDWTVCTEVGEHIPPQFEDVFLNNIVHNVKKGVVLSWGLPGQRGNGHVNGQTNEHVTAKMNHLGFDYDADKTKDFRNSTTLPWFRQTLMVFSKK